MALRKLRISGDPILRKHSREVTVIDDRMKELARDMEETLVKEEGIGIAAVQVGVLRRMIVVIIDDKPTVMINPEIIEAEGEIKDYEGCLSVPGKTGEVIRPEKIKVEYKNLEGIKEISEVEGYCARAVSHEVDHLDGILYIDKLEGPLYNSKRD